MTGSRRVLVLLLAPVALVLGLPAAAGAQPAAPTRYQGTLPDGATWIADVPSDWNGTLLLYSHGYIPGPANPPRNSPNQPTTDALLECGYALAGSSYSRVGWALATAADDQLATLAEVQRLIGRPEHVIAIGTSMGGLVTGQLAERAGGRIDGALATCGLMVGGIDLHNAQLDGLHALAQLLLPGQPVKLVRFASLADAVTTVNQLRAAIDQAQLTPQGRARIALAAAYFHMPSWFPGLPKPASHDYAAQEFGQYRNLQDNGLVASPLFRYQTGRFDVEQSSGGNVSWNMGVDYGQLLSQSATAEQVRSLYRDAELDLGADLDLLTSTADVAPDLAAVQWMSRTSTLSGELQMPVLSLHTVSDALAPVQFEQEYGEDVRTAGANPLLRRAYVDHAGHCAFTVAEWVAGVETIRARIEHGYWADLATAGSLQALAESYVPFHPGEFLGDRTP
ncbi:MAG TPA: alpha/beta hydrolase [Pseudonocardiaceae bacterium]|jgi:pimeloyl-ACP methyl ester carboxylesterase